MQNKPRMESRDGIPWQGAGTEGMAEVTPSLLLPWSFPKLSCELVIISNYAVKRCLQIPEVLAVNHKLHLDSLVDALLVVTLNFTWIFQELWPTL